MIKKFVCLLFLSISAVCVGAVQQPQQAVKDITVKGTVKDTDGAPLAGVSVVLKGSGAGVATDANGDFRLTFAQRSEIRLVFSFIGMATVETVVHDVRKPLNIVMKEDEIVAREIVVTGYYTLSKDRSAGSFSRVEGEALSLKTNAGILDRLNGMVAGFVVNKTGEDAYLLRGMTSINSVREPLFVVDGMPVERNVLEATVNPEEIANVNVLKDATASSIWGAKAANGVVIITTRRGNLKQKMKISYTGSVQLQGTPDFGYLDYMNAGDYVDFAAGVYDPSYNYANVIANYGVISPVERILYKQQTGDYTAERVEQELNRLRNSDNRQQITDNLYRPKTVQQHNLNLTGGNDNVAYFFSVNYRNTKPQQKGINEDRIIFDTKNDFTLTPWLKLTLGANVSFLNTESGLTPNVVGMIPYELLKDDNGNPLSQMHMFYSDEALAWTRNELDNRNMVHYDYRLLNELDKQENTSSAVNTRLQAGLKLKLLEGLELESDFRYQRGSGLREQIDKPDSYTVLNLRAEQTSTIAGSQSRIPAGSIADRTWSSSMEWIARNQIVFNRSFSEKNMLSLLAGTEVRKNTTETDNRLMYGYNETNRQYTLLDQIALQEGSEGGSIVRPTSQSAVQNFTRGFGTGILGSDNRFFSLYANAAYDYDRRYGVNASVRMDQANLFGTEIRNKPIWSTGILWNLHHEEFFKESGFDYLTLRTSRGIAGNTPNSNVGGPFDIISYGTMNNFYFAQSNNIVDIVSPSLKSLKWEKTTITNAGVDFSLLKGALSGSVDYYLKNTNDLIGLQTIDPTNGFSSISTNIGKIRNTGIEVALNSVNIRNRDFQWTTNLIFSYNKNKITDIYVEPQVTDYVKSFETVFIQGYAAYSLFSYRWAGLNDKGEPMVYDENGEKTDEMITSLDAIVHSGTAQPPLTGSLSNTFNYKNLRLGIQLIYNIGNKIRNDVPGVNTDSRVLYSQSVDSRSIWINPLHNDLRYAWKNPGDLTDVPRWLPEGETRSGRDYYSAADINILDGSYIYVNDITLGYTLPQIFVRQFGAGGCTVSAQVSNPFCWAFNGEGIDPRYVSSMTGYQRTLKYGPEYMLKLNIDF
jgi:TonB-linked SusC/RagA family outer membrane protein